MKFFFKIAAMFSFYLLVVTQAFANGEGSHAPGEMHKDVATVDPVLIIIPVVVILGGIIIWRVMFSKKQTLPTQPPQAQPEAPKVVQQSSQPENIEAKK
jgi:flagellar basal body-associated protein FliL